MDNFRIQKMDQWIRSTENALKPVFLGILIPVMVLNLKNFWNAKWHPSDVTATCDHLLLRPFYRLRLEIGTSFGIFISFEQLKMQM